MAILNVPSRQVQGFSPLGSALSGVGNVMQAYFGMKDQQRAQQQGQVPVPKAVNLSDQDLGINPNAAPAGPTAQEAIAGAMQAAPPPGPTPTPAGVFSGVTLPSLQQMLAQRFSQRPLFRMG